MRGPRREHILLAQWPPRHIQHIIIIHIISRTLPSSHIPAHIHQRRPNTHGGPPCGVGDWRGRAVSTYRVPVWGRTRANTWRQNKNTGKLYLGWRCDAFARGWDCVDVVDSPRSHLPHNAFVYQKGICSPLPSLRSLPFLCRAFNLNNNRKNQQYLYNIECPEIGG